MPAPLNSPYLVPTQGRFDLGRLSTEPPPGAPGKKDCKKHLAKLQDEIRSLQRKLYASDDHALLLVFQAMDAAGKDGTIRAVLGAVNPAGCQVFSFKQPSAEELDHDFLWRTAKSLPERGRIGIFNRSYYEEVLVVRVHPEYLKYQRIPALDNGQDLWDQRFESIRDHERHLAKNGTRILKFFLNVSKEEQRQRFLSRIDEPDKNWKFSESDVKERAHWNAYMRAYEDALGQTSREHAPWFAIPADDKPFMRLQVAKIIVEALKDLDPQYPQVSDDRRRELREMRSQLD